MLCCMSHDDCCTKPICCYSNLCKQESLQNCCNWGAVSNERNTSFQKLGCPSSNEMKTHKLSGNWVALSARGNCTCPEAGLHVFCHSVLNEGLSMELWCAVMPWQSLLWRQPASSASAPWRSPSPALYPLCQPLVSMSMQVGAAACLQGHMPFVTISLSQKGPHEMYDTEILNVTPFGNFQSHVSSGQSSPA